MSNTNAFSRTKYVKVIRELMSLGHPGIERASKRINIPVRTLQRQLHNAGLSYSDLVHYVRYKTACDMLKGTDVNIADIASALGFTNASNFSRAFVSWAGMPPRKYRQQNKH